MIASANENHTIETANVAIVPEDVHLTQDEIQEHVLTQLLEDPDIRAHSKAQLHQDIFALFQHNFKRGGYFVEFGATNGIDLSNTFLLEKNFSWKGILAEPGKKWWNTLNVHRNVATDNRCVWNKSGEVLKFKEAAMGELSTLSAFEDCDHQSHLRREGVEYDVTTISLMDLLAAHNAPHTIDYMSIDTEGSEYDILSAFDFTAYDVGVFTIEHNYTQRRDDILALMEQNGYKRIFTNLSKWDDWYIRA